MNDVNTTLKSLCDPAYTFKHGTQSKSMALRARHQEPLHDQYTSAPQRRTVFRHSHTHTYIDCKE